MCGITGYISQNSDAPIEQRIELLERMCASIIHRGPDEQGTLVRGRAALGMRRLSIIDILSGQQPIYSEDGNLAIVFNGEIYNFRELRSELENLGHRFKSNSDTEVIVHAFERFGTDCLKKLRGMFAFAIWNFLDESLFIARDRIGKKPLFYSLTPKGEFVFGSELKTLLTFGISRDVDPTALDAYLSHGYVPEEFCIFKGVHKLLPGHFLTYSNNKVEAAKYWDIDMSQPDTTLSESDWVAMLREKIRESVNIRMISEVPLGAFLSGGIDSSTVVAAMSELSEQPVKTFSIGFREDSYDELKYARIAAKKFGTEHHEFIVTPKEFDIASDVAACFDEPFADQSSLPSYLLARLAREHVTVVLSGDGGDETFAGYERYVIDRRRSGFSAMPRFIRESLVRRVSGSMPHGALGKNFLYNASLDPVGRYIDSVSTFNAPRKKALYSDGFASSLNGQGSATERLFRRYADSVSGNATNRLLYLDSKTYLPGDILTKVDRMSMANSLEARVPLLDHELIEMAARIPADLKMRGLETKYILKRAMEGLVPDEILYRKKQGFGVPIGKWINDQLRDRMNDDLLSQRTRERGFFDPAYIQLLMKEHAQARRDHSNALWSLWMLELWFRIYVDERPADS